MTSLRTLLPIAVVSIAAALTSSLALAQENDPYIVPTDLNGNGKDFTLLIQRSHPNWEFQLGILDLPTFGTDRQLLFPWHIRAEIPGRTAIGDWPLESGDRFQPVDLDVDGTDELLAFDHDGTLAIMTQGPTRFELFMTWVADVVSGPAGDWEFGSIDAFYPVHHDFDPDPELFVHDGNTRIGIFQSTASGFEHVWRNPTEFQDGLEVGYLDGPAGRWYFSGGDTFQVLDLDGDGIDEIGVFNEFSAAVLQPTAAGYRTVYIAEFGDPFGFIEGETPAERWYLDSNDRFHAADLNGDGRDEIVAINDYDNVVGILVANRQGLHCVYRATGTIGGAGGAFELDEPKALPLDVDGDGADELFVYQTDRVAILTSPTLEDFETAWVRVDTIGGREPWTIRGADSWYPAELNGQPGEELVAYRQHSNNKERAGAFLTGPGTSLRAVWNRRIGTAGHWGIDEYTDTRYSVPFPDYDTGDDNLAYRAISRELEPAASNDDIRSLYATDAARAGAWHTTLGDLVVNPYPGQIPEDSWVRVREQLLVEFTDLDKVYNTLLQQQTLFDDLKGLQETNVAIAQANVASIFTSGGRNREPLFSPWEYATLGVQAAGAVHNKAAPAYLAAVVAIQIAERSQPEPRNCPLTSAADFFIQYEQAVLSQHADIIAEFAGIRNSVYVDWGRLHTFATFVTVSPLDLTDGTFLERDRIGFYQDFLHHLFEIGRGDQIDDTPNRWKHTVQGTELGLVRINENLSFPGANLEDDLFDNLGYDPEHRPYGVRKKQFFTGTNGWKFEVLPE